MNYEINNVIWYGKYYILSVPSWYGDMMTKQSIAKNKELVTMIVLIMIISLTALLVYVSQIFINAYPTDIITSVVSVIIMGVTLYSIILGHNTYKIVTDTIVNETDQTNELTTVYE